LEVGRNREVGLTTTLWAERSGDWIPLGGQDFPHRFRRGYPIFCAAGKRSKETGVWREPFNSI